MKINRIFLLLIILLLNGCGGGSEGTGTADRAIFGTIQLDDGSPFNQGNVTILETGESTTTDNRGSYLIITSAESSSLTIEIAKDDVKGSASIEGLTTETSQVMANFTVTARGDASLVSVEYLQIFAHIEGDCAKYFSNKQVIRQTKTVPDNLNCTLRFFASGDGRRLERIRAQVEVRTCNPLDPWRLIAEGLTGSGLDAGVGDINFDFIDNRKNCLYRLIAPINDPQNRQSEILIETLSFQHRQTN